jgi:hypothetical protein
MRLAELRTKAVDVVVGASDADQVGPIDAGGEQLLFLEVRRHEHVRLESGGGGVRGDGVGEVPGRGAGHGSEAEFLGLRDRDRDDAVLEGVCGVGGVVLDPELAQAEALGQAVGPDQGRQPRLERVARPAVEGEEVGLPPDSPRARLDLPARLLGIQVRQVIGDLQRPEALLADVSGIERVGLPALLASQRFNCHLAPLRKKPPPG